MRDYGHVRVVALGEEPPALEFADDPLGGDDVSPGLPDAGFLVDRDRVECECRQLVGHGDADLGPPIRVGGDHSGPEHRVAELAADDGFGELRLPALLALLLALAKAVPRRHLRRRHGEIHLRHRLAGGLAVFPAMVPVVSAPRREVRRAVVAAGRRDALVPRVTVEALFDRLAELRLNVVDAGVHEHQGDLPGDRLLGVHVGYLDVQRGLFTRLIGVVFPTAHGAFLSCHFDLQEAMRRGHDDLLDVAENLIVADLRCGQEEVGTVRVLDRDRDQLGVLLDVDDLAEDQPVGLAGKQHARVGLVGVDEHLECLTDLILVFGWDDLQRVVGVVGLGSGFRRDPERAGALDRLGLVALEDLTDDDLDVARHIGHEPNRRSARGADLDRLVVQLLGKLFLERTVLLSNTLDAPGLDVELTSHRLLVGVLGLDIDLDAVAGPVD